MENLTRFQYSNMNAKFGIGSYGRVMREEMDKIQKAQLMEKLNEEERVLANVQKVLKSIKQKLEVEEMLLRSIIEPEVNSVPAQMKSEK